MKLANERLREVLKHAITAYTFELDSQDYLTEAELYSVVLNEFQITNEEFEEIMGMTFKQWR
jgi:DNA-binding protein Fis